MADYSLSASKIIVDYLWQNLQDENILDPDDYSLDILNGPATGVIPIVPSQQDMLNYEALDGKTHIVYDWVADGYEENWLICRDSIMFTTYSKSPVEILKIQNLILDLFRRMDDSARDINSTLPSNSPFIFYSISLADMLSPEPQREKSGWFAAQAVIRYKYGRQVNASTGRFA